jgi:hypothetical protein
MRGQLSLSDEVYFCIAEGQGVFLDLNRDAYNAIPLGTPATADGVHSPDDVLRAFDRHREELLQEGLLAERCGDETSILVFRGIPRPSGNLFPDDQRAYGLAGHAGKEVVVRARDALDFFRSARCASALLKDRHIREIVAGVRARKGDPSGNFPNLEALRREVAVFRKLRPWYPRHYLCLWDSLALIEFLARRRLYPLWIFGVQVQPFGAHCWLQADDLLLNEATEYAGQFTPIMAV